MDRINKQNKKCPVISNCRLPFYTICPSIKSYNSNKELYLYTSSGFR